MTKAPQCPPKNAKKPPPPPPPPPNRTYRDVLFVGLVETRESKKATRDYEIYMRGYSDGSNSNKNR